MDFNHRYRLPFWEKNKIKSQKEENKPINETRIIMNIIAKLLGLLIAGFGTAIFASPQVTQKIFQFFKEDKRIYIAGVVRAFTGVVLLLAASQSVVPVAAIALGIMFL